MKSYVSIFIAACCLWLPQAASAQVGVSITIGDPGYYGRIDVGDYPRPRFIFDEPIWIERSPQQNPLYLHVPPGHARNWDKHCARYDACRRPVYFVDDGWYEEVYVPAYRARHSHSGDDDHHDDYSDRGNDGNKGKGKGNKGHRGKGNN